MKAGLYDSEYSAPHLLIKRAIEEVSGEQTRVLRVEKKALSSLSLLKLKAQAPGLYERLITWKLFAAAPQAAELSGTCASSTAAWAQLAHGAIARKKPLANRSTLSILGILSMPR